MRTFYFLLLNTLSFVIVAKCQTNVPKVLSCENLIKKGYTRLFCEYDKKKGFKDILFGSKLSDLRKKVNIEPAPNKNSYTLTELEDQLFYQDWNGKVYYSIQFQFNKLDQLFSVRLYIDDNSKTEDSNYVFIVKYEDIVGGLENKFGKAKLYQLNDSSEVYTKGNIYGWEGNNIKVLIKKLVSGRIVVTIYCSKYDTDKEVDDL